MDLCTSSAPPPRPVAVFHSSTASESSMRHQDASHSLGSCYLCFLLGQAWDQMLGSGAPRPQGRSPGSCPLWSPGRRLTPLVCPVEISYFHTRLSSTATARSIRFAQPFLRWPVSWFHTTSSRPLPVCLAAGSVAKTEPSHLPRWGCKGHGQVSPQAWNSYTLISIPPLLKYLLHLQPRTK